MDHYKRGSHTVWDCKYHLVWATKYRYSVLAGMWAGGAGSCYEKSLESRRW
jgi:REP element-mobilizing transposase RayT